MSLVFFFISQTILLIFTANSLDISPYEANIYYQDTGYLNYLSHCVTKLFGESNIALRLPFIIIHLMSLVLLYLIIKPWMTKTSDVLLSLTIFAILPGVFTSALLVDKSVILTFVTLLFIYLFKRNHLYAYLLIFALAFLDQAMLGFFIILILYGLARRHYTLSIASLVTLFLNFVYFDFSLKVGIEKSYFFEIFISYAMVFSPLIFFYLLYTLYFYCIRDKEQMPIEVFLALGIFILSLFFAIKSKIVIHDFAPFVVVALPRAIACFLHAFRVKLARFRFKDKFLATVLITSLIINILVVVFNKSLYLIVDDIEQHFAYKQHFTKEVSDYLKSHNILAVNASTQDMQKQLAFYGIKKGNQYYLTDTKTPNSKAISVNVLGRIIRVAFLQTTPLKKIMNKNL